MTMTKVESRKSKVENQPVSQQAAPVPPAKQEVAERTQEQSVIEHILELKQQRDDLLGHNEVEIPSNVLRLMSEVLQ